MHDVTNELRSDMETVKTALENHDLHIKWLEDSMQKSV